MEIDERDDWLFVRLLPEDKVKDLDWGGLIRWKIPGVERIFVSELDVWIVRIEFRDLVERLFAIYRSLGEAGQNMDQLQKVQAQIDDIDRRYPSPAEGSEAGRPGWLSDIGLN